MSFDAAETTGGVRKSGRAMKAQHMYRGHTHSAGGPQGRTDRSFSREFLESFFFQNQSGKMKKP